MCAADAGLQIQVCLSQAVQHVPLMLELTRMARSGFCGPDSDPDPGFGNSLDPEEEQELHSTYNLYLDRIQVLWKLGQQVGRA